MMPQLLMPVVPVMLGGPCIASSVPLVANAVHIPVDVETSTTRAGLSISQYLSGPVSGPTGGDFLCRQDAVAVGEAPGYQVEH